MTLEVGAMVTSFHREVTFPEATSLVHKQENQYFQLTVCLQSPCTEPSHSPISGSQHEGCGYQQEQMLDRLLGYIKKKMKLNQNFNCNE